MGGIKNGRISSQRIFGEESTQGQPKNSKLGVCPHFSKTFFYFQKKTKFNSPCLEFIEFVMRLPDDDDRGIEKGN